MDVYVPPRRQGGTKATSLEPDASYGIDLYQLPPTLSDRFITRPENLKHSVDTVLEKLRGKKRLDLFECARVDRNVSIEETIKTLAGFVKEGKFDYIGTSETSAATLKRANAVSTDVISSCPCGS